MLPLITDRFWFPMWFEKTAWQLGSVVAGRPSRDVVETRGV
jgi:hypothetical protein